MLIKPTRKAQGSIFDIHEDAADILLYPRIDDIPCPWDADILVEGDKVILLGSLAPTGPSGFCRCECSINEFTRYYKLEAPDNNALLYALEEAGWTRAQ